MIASKRHGLALGAVLIATFGVQPAAALDVIKVADAQKGFWDTAFVFLGQERGFFKEQAIELDIQWTDGGAETQQAVITGSFPLVLATGRLRAVRAYAKDSPCVLSTPAKTA